MNKKIQKQTALQVLSALSKNQNSVDYFKTVRSLRKNSGTWYGQSVIPAGSFTDKVTSLVRETTDMPLEIPLNLAHHYIAAYLLSNRVTIKLAGQTLLPDFWTIILGPSGAGKTYIKDWLDKIFSSVSIPMMPSTKSGAQFVSELEIYNKGLWIRDEFGQFMKELEAKTGPQVDMREYLLDLYGGGKIERRTKQETTVIEHAALSIAGLTVGETFFDQISPESIVDGLGQRFTYVYADPDPDRPMRDHAIYTLYEKNTRSIEKDIEKMFATVQPYDVFKVGPKGREAFVEAFRAFADEASIPPSFFRRAMFRAVQYALIYHVMLKKKSKTIDENDIAWGTRLVALNLRDASRLLDGHGISDVEKWCRRAEEIRDKCESKGEPFTPRAIIRGINAIRSASEAQNIIRLIA